jgi:type I restriction enzyme, S subunit
MASVSKRPKTFFRLGPAGRLQALCFGVRRGELAGRIDVNFWRLLPAVSQRLKNPKFPLVSLGACVSLVQYGSSRLAKTEPPGLPILRMNNLQDDGWDLSDLKYVQLNDSEIQTYRLAHGDILFNRTNSKELVGKCAVFGQPDEWVFASYLIRVRAVAEKLLPQFASDYLATAIGRLQIDWLSRQIIGMTNINAEEIRALRIPLPPPRKQAEFVVAMDAARLERRLKLAQADEIMDGMDAILTRALGLKPPKIDDRNVFAVRLKEIKSKPISPGLYAPQLRHFIKALRSGPFDAGSLSDHVQLNPKISSRDDLNDNSLVSFVPMEAVAERATGEVSLRDRLLKDVRKGYTPFAEGDVLWAKITPCMQNGKSFVARSLTNGVGFGSTEFHVLRPKSNLVASDYIHAFMSQLRLRKAATLTFTGSAGQQRVPTEFLGLLPFPLPPMSIQTEIVSELASRHDEASRLRTAAEADWQAAKQWLEQQLLETPS